jgi:small subunit ribosomal protein S4
MSRYTGPRVRAMRALGVQLPGLSSKAIERRPFPPGQHGQARRKLSEYGLRLIEKQKLCRNYGVTEGQLRRLMIAARSAKGPTGERLLELLESRLDNVVFRAGFARTIPAARQLVNHGHILVDGKKVDVPSFSVKPNQVIGLHARSKDLPFVIASVTAGRGFDTSWLSVNPAERLATVTTAPDAASVPFPVAVQLVVEFYSQRI